MCKISPAAGGVDVTSLSVLAGCNYVSKTRVLYHVLSDTLFLSLVCS